MLPGQSTLATWSTPLAAAGVAEGRDGLAVRVPSTATIPPGRGLGAVLHRPAPLGDQPHGVLKAEGPGEDQRRVFAERQAGGDRGRLERRRIAGPQHLEGRQARHQDRRLTDGRRVEPLGRPAAADVQQVVAKDLGAAGEEIGRGGVLLDPVARHPDRLGTLAGKQQRWWRQCLPERSPKALLLGLDDGAAHVVAAGLADPVGRYGLAAGRAERQLPGRKEIVGPPGAGSSGWTVVAWERP